MTEDVALPDGWTEVIEGHAPLDQTPRAGFLESLTPAERVEEVARGHLNAALGEAWLFPPVAADGSVVFLFGRHDIDPEGNREVRLTEPLGVVRVTGEDVTIDWRWSTSPEDATEDTAPIPSHSPLSEAMQTRPSFERDALTTELYRRAAEFAVAAADGTATRLGSTNRLVELFSFLIPDWLVPYYIEAAPDYLESIGWQAGVPIESVPAASADDIPTAIAEALGPLEAMVLTTTTGLQAALEAQGIAIEPHSPLVDLPQGDAAAAVGLEGAGRALRALAAPGWLLHAAGLSDSGFIDFSVAISEVDGDVLWTGLSAADGSVIVSPDADPDSIVAVVEGALDGAGIGPQGPIYMPLRADHMILGAALADEHTVVGDDAFSATTARLQMRIDEPSPTGVVAALTSLAQPPHTRLEDGFGLADYLAIDGGAVYARPMIQKFVRWLTRPRARLTVTLTDLDRPDGDEPLTTGYSFLRTEDGLFVFAVTDPWRSGGMEADRRIDVAAIGTNVLHQMVKGLLGISERVTLD